MEEVEEILSIHQQDFPENAMPHNLHQNNLIVFSHSYMLRYNYTNKSNDKDLRALCVL